MSCAGKGYGTNPKSDAYLYAQFNSSFVSNPSSSIIPTSSRNCRKFGIIQEKISENLSRKNTS